MKIVVFWNVYLYVNKIKNELLEGFARMISAIRFSSTINGTFNFFFKDSDCYDICNNYKRKNFNEFNIFLFLHHLKQKKKNEHRKFTLRIFVEK